MSLILVTPLSALPEMMRTYQPSHLVTLLSPEYMIETPGGFPEGRHLRVACNDIADPAMGPCPPCEDHIAGLIEFSRSWDAQRPMIVHCWAGVSRSMAASYAILCDRAWRGAEYRIAREIRSRAPHAHPNRLLVRIADQFLDREGRMVQAVEEIGPGAAVEEGKPVEFPLADFGL
jgi:predicted protein tyrosine phosphatase